jgi:hypothetical protein
MRGLVFAAALLCASAAQAETRCESRAAVGGGTLTTCREVGTGRAQEFRTRPAVGGGTITTGGGRTCATRAGVGGIAVTTCR